MRTLRNYQHGTWPGTPVLRNEYSYPAACFRGTRTSTLKHGQVCLILLLENKSLPLSPLLIRKMSPQIHMGQRVSS